MACIANNLRDRLNQSDGEINNGTIEEETKAAVDLLMDRQSQLETVREIRELFRSSGATNEFDCVVDAGRGYRGEG